MGEGSRVPLAPTRGHMRYYKWPRRYARVDDGTRLQLAEERQLEWQPLPGTFTLITGSRPAPVSGTNLAYAKRPQTGGDWGCFNGRELMAAHGVVVYLASQLAQDIWRCFNEHDVTAAHGTATCALVQQQQVIWTSYSGLDPKTVHRFFKPVSQQLVEVISTC